MKHILVGAALAALALPAQADEVTGPGWIFQIFDKFALVQVIGERCGTPTPEEETTYANKFREVGELAEGQAHALNPSLAPGQFSEFSAKQRHAMQSSAARFLDDHGCEAPDAIALAKEYRTLMDLNLPQTLAR